MDDVRDGLWGLSIAELFARLDTAVAERQGRPRLGEVPLEADDYERFKALEWALVRVPMVTTRKQPATAAACERTVYARSLAWAVQPPGTFRLSAQPSPEEALRAAIRWLLHDAEEDAAESEAKARAARDRLAVLEGLTR